MLTQTSLPFDAPFESGPPSASGRQPTVVPRVDFVRHPRARRYVVRVRDDGSVRVTIPRWGSKRDAQAFADAERAWIERELGRVREAQARPRETLDPAIERDLRARARRELPARLRDIAATLGVSVSRVSVRNQRWRWGSCSRTGHICLNWRLVRMPDAIRDYVIIHELMHVTRLDHSARFWKLVGAACPGYQDARRWLHEQGEALR